MAEANSLEKTTSVWKTMLYFLLWVALPLSS
jgi:hypothetical protein